MSLVSVIIPTYNRPGMVVYTVESVLTQTFQDFEIIVVDDGSEQSAYEALLKLQARVPQIRLFQQSNLGRASARNTGLQNAQGDYVVFCDDDDLLLTEKLQKQVDFLAQHPDFGVVYSNMLYCEEQGKVLCTNADYHGGKHPTGDIYEALLTRSWIHTPVCALVRKSCLDEVGGFDVGISCGEDWDLWLRLAARYKFHYQEEPLAIYRIHAQMSSLDHAENAAMLIKVRQKIELTNDFRLASANSRSHFYSIYGSMQVMLGEISAGRKLLFKAICIEPLQVRAYFLLIFSLLGQAIFRRIIFLKRWLVRKIKNQPEVLMPEYI